MTDPQIGMMMLALFIFIATGAVNAWVFLIRGRNPLVIND